MYDVGVPSSRHITDDSWLETYHQVGGSSASSNSRSEQVRHLDEKAHQFQTLLHKPGEYPPDFVIPPNQNTGVDTVSLASPQLVNRPVKCSEDSVIQLQQQATPSYDEVPLDHDMGLEPQSYDLITSHGQHTEVDVIEWASQQLLDQPVTFSETLWNQLQQLTPPSDAVLLDNDLNSVPQLCNMIASPDHVTVHQCTDSIHHPCMNHSTVRRLLSAS
ncbi:hypothetical protein K440DRAFT_638110 [Wilcoxina mikolae CBS 423.85]|nr:hypothetical protein K440DRAFT_638110 [Wilcoxina mikolae CBS 423.85]